MPRDSVDERPLDAPDPAPEEVQETQDADPQVDTSPLQTDEPSDEPQPTFNLSLVPDSGLEAPVFINVPGLHQDLTPLPALPQIQDDDGNFLPGYDENSPTLVETEDGYQRPEDAEQTHALVDGLDEHGRLKVSTDPVEVPASVADVLADTPYLKIEQVYG